VRDAVNWIVTVWCISLSESITVRGASCSVLLLQRVAVCCIVLHCVAVCAVAWCIVLRVPITVRSASCSALQCVAVCCIVLHCVTVYCSVVRWFQRADYNTMRKLLCVAVFCRVLHSVA